MKTITCAVALVAALAAGCMFSGRASVRVETGFFFGLDVRQERSVLYVLDLSGSMSETSGTVVEQAGTDATGKLAGTVTGGFLGRRAGNAVESRIKKLKKKVEKVKLHLIASLHGLPVDATFNIILFSNGVHKLSPTPIPATAGNIALVSAFVARLEEGGGTNMYAAIEAAMLEHPGHVILLTDGLPTSSTPDAILDMVRGYNAGGGIVVSTVGVGIDQARGFLAALADENGGTFTMYN